MRASRRPPRATQPGHAVIAADTTTPRCSSVPHRASQAIFHAEPRAPPRLLRPPCAGLPRPMPESLVVTGGINPSTGLPRRVRHDHPATPKTVGRSHRDGLYCSSYDGPRTCIFRCRVISAGLSAIPVGGAGNRVPTPSRTRQHRAETTTRIMQSAAQTP